jgi:uncharacterized membrane protein
MSNNNNNTPHNIMQKQQVVVARQEFSGPLPHPSVLAEYEHVYPGSAKMIFDRFEKQSDHRMFLEKTVVQNREKQSNRGQLFAFIIALALIVFAAFALYLEYPKIAATICSVTLIGVVTVFIKGKVDQKNSIQEKQNPNPNPNPNQNQKNR